jgi:hypothetical protein
MRRRGTSFRTAAGLGLLAMATAASAAGPVISEPLATKSERWALLIAGVVVVGLIAWRRLGGKDFTDD